MPTTAPQNLTVDNRLLFGANLGYDYEFDGAPITGTTSLPALWSFANPGATPIATYLEKFGAGTVTATRGTGHHLHTLKRGMVGWPSTWVVTAKLGISLALSTGSPAAGLVVRSGDGKSTAFVMEANESASNAATLAVIRYTQDEVFSTVRQSASAADVSESMLYMRIRKTSATSYFFEWSPDGRAWIGMTNAEDLSAFHTISEIGFGVDPDNGSFDGAISCEWFRVR